MGTRAVAGTSHGPEVCTLPAMSTTERKAKPPPKSRTCPQCKNQSLLYIVSGVQLPPGHPNPIHWLDPMVICYEGCEVTEPPEWSE
jgi:hypothetical protein